MEEDQSYSELQGVSEAQIGLENVEFEDLQVLEDPKVKLATAESNTRARSSSEKRLPSLVDPQPTVRVHVHSPDGNEQTFHIHKNFICHHSPFFEAAFNSNFKEGETQEMDFDDTDIKVFGIFVNWLYTQRILDSKNKRPRCGTLMNLWLLADRILIPRLQNQALVELDKSRLRGGRISRECQRVFDNTREDSPLREYIIDTWDFNTYLERDSAFPQELLVELVNSVTSREDPATKPVLSERNRSRYFIHVTNVQSSSRTYLQGLVGLDESARHTEDANNTTMLASDGVQVETNEAEEGARHDCKRSSDLPSSESKRAKIGDS